MSVPEKIPLSELSRGDLEGPDRTPAGGERRAEAGGGGFARGDCQAQGCDGGSRDPTEWHGAEDRAEADGQDRQAWRQTAQNWSLMQLVIDEERVIKVDGVALQGLRGLHRPGSGAAPACRAHPPGALAHARRADHPRADAGWGCRPLWA